MGEPRACREIPNSQTQKSSGIPDLPEETVGKGMVGGGNRCLDYLEKIFSKFLVFLPAWPGELTKHLRVKPSPGRVFRSSPRSEMGVIIGKSYC